MLPITETEEGVSFAVRIVPRSSRNEIAGIQDDALKIKLTAPPVEGRANEACVKYLSRVLGVAGSCVTITAGLKSKNKRLFVAGITRAELESRIREP